MQSVSQLLVIALTHNASNALPCSRLLAGNCREQVLTTCPLRQVFSMLTLSKNITAPGARFSLLYLEGMGWKDVAALFNDADVILVAHGAQAANVVFMPLKSQGVHVANMEGHAQGTASLFHVGHCAD